MITRKDFEFAAMACDDRRDKMAAMALLNQDNPVAFEYLDGQAREARRVQRKMMDLAHRRWAVWRTWQHWWRSSVLRLQGRLRLHIS